MIPSSRYKTLLSLAVATVTAMSLNVSADESSAKVTSSELPDPDGKPADMTKPVKVFIMMGQSNLFGMGDLLKAAK